MVDTKLIKELREATGVSIADCRNALIASDGDMEAALEHLKSRGKIVAGKKSGRDLGSGAFVFSPFNGGLAIMGMSCETDFVSTNEKFLDGVSKLIDISLKNGAGSLDDVHSLEEATSFKSELIHVLGENLQPCSFVKIAVSETEAAGVYKHGRGGKIGVIVVKQFDGDADKAVTVARDIAMHALAMRPEFISSEDIPSEIIEAKKQEILDSVQGNKPEIVLERIVSGKLASFFQERCLLNQEFVKEDGVTVEEFLHRELGENARVTQMRVMSI